MLSEDDIQKTKSTNTVSMLASLLLVQRMEVSKRPSLLRS